jgi:hypothetical protein
MDLFDLLIIGAVIYAMLRGMARAGRKAGAPQEPEEPPLEAREWSEDMGDVLEGLGFPRPSGPSRIPQAPPGQQDVHTEEAAGLATAEARKPVEARRPARVREPQERIERGKALADIAAIAEAAARKRARAPDRARREVTAPGPSADLKPARPPKGTSRAGSLLPQLDRYSELERAILYAEILAPPKALRD